MLTLIQRSSVVSAVILFAAGCGKGHSDLRGRIEPSRDGKTYLAILDDNGGQCGPMLVDGTKWRYAIGKVGPIAPGRHRIECGTDIEIDIAPGTTFSFDYWGP